jgi:hypothetical protein
MPLCIFPDVLAFHPFLLEETNMDKKRSTHAPSDNTDAGIPIQVKLLLGVLIFAVGALVVKLTVTF